MAIRVLITEGTRADCKEAVNLIQGIYAYALRPGYDTKETTNLAVNAGIDIVISPKCNRKSQKEYNHNTYKFRHLVKNAFLHLKTLARNCCKIC